MAEAPVHVAIIFADVSGSTSLYEKLGDRKARETVESMLTAMRKSVAIHQGRVVKTIGDEVMAALPSADAAMQAACDMQIRISEMPALDNVKLAIRVGFHYGPAIEQEGDYFGDAVNVASRMAGLAKGSQIITTAATVEALSPLLRQSTRDLDTLAIRGKQDGMRIYEVLWQDSEELTTLAPRESRPPASEAQLRLKCGDRELVLGPVRPAGSLGRDASNDLAIPGKMASRVHARIEYRLGKFVLTDQSTNGTYVTVEGDREVVLRREQILLRGKGWISLGQPATSAEAQPVAYAIEQGQGT